VAWTRSSICLILSAMITSDADILKLDVTIIDPTTPLQHLIDFGASPCWLAEWPTRRCRA
jgi:hypothetical protein